MEVVGVARGGSCRKVKSISSPWLTPVSDFESLSSFEFHSFSSRVLLKPEARADTEPSVTERCTRAGFVGTTLGRNREGKRGIVEDDRKATFMKVCA